jgi:cytidylate kinase
MYRAITVLAQRAGLDLTDGDKVTLVAAEAALDVGDRVRSHGVDLTDALRTDEVNAGVSVVSAHPGVRAVLVAEQRAWIGRRDGAVVEGRDIGTVVWPEAKVKVYLTASDAERARRRTEEPGDSVARRDQLDERRAASPLRAAEDAHVLDTTDRAVEDVVAEILGLL